jgi:hypothetical protein
MRYLLLVMMHILVLMIVGNAQDILLKPAPSPGTKSSARLVLADAKAVKNKPFSAEGVSETIQVLVDGNRITRSTTVRMFRDSEGRFRREGSGGTGGIGSSFFGSFPLSLNLSKSDMVTIIDPVNSVRYTLDTSKKTVRRYDVPKTFELAKTLNKNLEKNTQKITELKLRQKLVEKRQTEINELKTNTRENPDVVIVEGLGTLNRLLPKSESLGTKIMEGLEVEGTRTVKTIKAGAIGNDLPIEITYEKWFSKDLDMIVYSRKYDPRYGEQIYRLVNIDRSEPDSLLFTVPADYKIVDGRYFNLKTIVEPK